MPVGSLGLNSTGDAALSRRESVFQENWNCESRNVSRFEMKFRDQERRSYSRVLLLYCDRAFLHAKNFIRVIELLLLQTKLSYTQKRTKIGQNYLQHLNGSARAFHTVTTRVVTVWNDGPIFLVAVHIMFCYGWLHFLSEKSQFAMVGFNAGLQFI
jgi:hypothetical protein